MIPQRIVRGARLDTVKVQSAADVNHLAGREREAAAHERRHGPRYVLGLAPARDRHAAIAWPMPRAPPVTTAAVMSIAFDWLRVVRGCTDGGYRSWLKHTS
jgi:hypothetical protein